MKKIVIVTAYFAPAWSYGGPPRVLFNLAKSFIKKGIEVTIVTTDAMDEKRNNLLFEKLEGIKIHRFPTISNYLAYKSKLFFVPNFIGKTKDIFSKADMVIFSDIRTVINLQIYPYLKSHKIPYSVFAFGQIPYDGYIKTILKMIFDFFWVKDFVGNALLKFAQTNHEKDMYKKYFPTDKKNTFIVPLPISTELKRVNPEKIINFRKKFGILDSERVIIFVGRLNKLKGIDLLIRSLSPFLRNNSKFKLMIVGRDDGHEPFLKKLVSDDLKDKIIFTGPLYNDDVSCAYCSSDCFVITPTYYEETSTAALEALKHGIPVVVTKQADIPWLQKYKAGLVTEAISDKIQESVLEILNLESQNKKRVSEKAKSLINDHYSSDKIAENLIKIFTHAKV